MGLLKKLFGGKRYPINGTITIKGETYRIMKAQAGTNRYLPYWNVYGVCNQPQQVIEQELNRQGYKLRKLGGIGNVCMTIKKK